ncbi:GspE/PulE family protein [Labrys sp. 22185]|uniref:GspE/PulE family protein n=1 Tax=Labrys sp. 22185 TaxID=3453888 RepID=UPI003F84B09A
MALSEAILSSTPELDRLVDFWLSKGALQPDNLERGRSAARASGERIDRVLSKLGLIADQDYAQGWAEILDLDVASDFPDPPYLIPQLPIGFLVRAAIVPLRHDGDTLVVAVGDPLDRFSLAATAAKIGAPVVAEVARPADIMRATDRLAEFQGESAQAENTSDGLASDVDRLRDLASDAPAIRAIETMIDRAVDGGASDIHILPTALGGRVRVRVDGVLRDLSNWSRELTLAVTSRLKVMAGLDIAESRLPQDGRLRAPHRGVEIDFRMATIPHIHGEGIVLRVLHRVRATPDLGTLGLPREVLGGLESLVASPNGLLLVTGPTGSGKTTTLYATLQRLARPDRNIVTVEDPVEHALEGTAQVQVERKIGFDFAQALRSILRHDPDVVMVGEIRDAETASIAVRAALTGHLVLATVHTNSALDAVPRLIDMGIEPWLLASTLRGCMAQRLVRRLCHACRKPAPGKFDWSSYMPRIASYVDGSGPRVFEANGCPQCAGTGYQGRVAVGEFIASTPSLRQAIATGASGEALRTAAPSFASLLDDGLMRLWGGETSLSELQRVLGEELLAVGLTEAAP